MDTEHQFDLPSQEFLRLGSRSLEIAQRALAAESQDPAMPRIDGPSSRQLVDEPLPRESTDPDAILDIIERDILPNCRRNGHPRFFGYVSSSADPLGVLADLIASGLNQNVTAWRSAPIASEIERLVIRWLDELVGFRGGGNGVLVSGGSAANAAGLTCALAEAARGAGLTTPARDRMTVYVSREGHLSLRKAGRILGVPVKQIRSIEVDGEFRLRVPELDQMIEADRAAGLIPACVCASAGTTNTGAVDPLDEIATLCAARGLWLHIDGAYGGPAASTKSGSWMGSGIGRADSMSLDAHKWLFAPLDAGCALIRDQEAARRTFCEPADYTKVSRTDSIERYAFFDHGPELSRRFRALKIWMSIKAHGARAISNEIERHIELRRRLDSLVEDDERLELLGSGLSISCFRYIGAGGASEEELDELNRAILKRIVSDGGAFMSPTRIGTRFSLRTCIISFRTQWRDLEWLLGRVRTLGDETALRGAS